MRDGGLIWAGSKITLSENLDFSTLNSISMKVFTSAPIGTTVKFKLEGGSETERDFQTTVANEWEVMTWDFTGAANNFNSLVFLFDFGNVGDGSANSTFFFDDIEQLFGGAQIDFPVNFEDPEVNYNMTDFGGNASSLATDPTDPINTVIQVTKTAEAAEWAGTTIGTAAGFASNIPLTLSNSKMTVKVWSPEAGTPIRLKVEDSNDPTHTCETETNTTVSADWEVMEFDFATQAPGTEFLSIGLDMGWTYNMASLFFNFGTGGETAGEKTYYFDDVKFGESALGISNEIVEGLNVFPNPSKNQWTVQSKNTVLTSVEVFDLQGRLLLALHPNDSTVKIDAAFFSKGTYVCKVTTETGTGSFQLLKE